MSKRNEAYKNVMSELKERIGKHGSDRLNKKSEHHEPDGDEDAKGNEPDEDDFDLDSCGTCGSEDHRTTDCDK
jgi:hypothetical protein